MTFLYTVANDEGLNGKEEEWKSDIISESRFGSVREDSWYFIHALYIFILYYIEKSPNYYYSIFIYSRKIFKNIKKNRFH